MKPDRDLLFERPPRKDGMAQFETLHEDAEGNVLSYECVNAPGIMHRPGVGRAADMPILPFLGPMGGVLIVIPTVGHNKFATDLNALTGWTMAIGIGTGAEAAGNTDLSSIITTYGGAAAPVTPTVLDNVVTWAHKWTFTTGASFAVIEAGVKKDTILMMRHLYSVAKNVVTTDKLTATLTDTL